MTQVLGPVSPGTGMDTRLLWVVCPHTSFQRRSVTCVRSSKGSEASKVQELEPPAHVSGGTGGQVVCWGPWGSLGLCCESAAGIPFLPYLGLTRRSTERESHAGPAVSRQSWGVTQRSRPSLVPSAGGSILTGTVSSASAEPGVGASPAAAPSKGVMFRAGPVAQDTETAFTSQCLLWTGVLSLVLSRVEQVTPR